MALTTKDWQRIRQRYERGETYEELARAFGVSVSTIGRHRKAEGWEERGAARGKPVAGQCVEELTREMLRTARAALAEGEGRAGVREMRDMVALVRELLTLQRMAREEQDTDREERVHVVLERDVEDWSV